MATHCHTTTSPLAIQERNAAKVGGCKGKFSGNPTLENSGDSARYFPHDHRIAKQPLGDKRV